MHTITWLEDIEDIQLSNVVIPDTLLKDQTNYYPFARGNVKKNSATNIPNEQNATDKTESTIYLHNHKTNNTISDWETRYLGLLFTRSSPFK